MTKQVEEANDAVKCESIKENYRKPNRHSIVGKPH